MWILSKILSLFSDKTVAPHQDSTPPPGVESPDDPNTFYEPVYDDNSGKSGSDWRDFFISSDSKRKKELDERLFLIEERLDALRHHIPVIIQQKEEIVEIIAPEIQFSDARPSVYVPAVFKPKRLGKLPMMNELATQKRSQQKQQAEEKALLSLVNAREALAVNHFTEALDSLTSIFEYAVFIDDPQLEAAIREVFFDISEKSTHFEAEKRDIDKKLNSYRTLAEQKQAICLEKIRQEEETEKAALQDKEYQERLRRARLLIDQLRERECIQRKELSKRKLHLASRKADAKDILSFLNDLGIKCLYHITEESNIPLIKARKALFSRHFLSSHDMTIPVPGGDTNSCKLDDDLQITDYIHLSFRPHYQTARNILSRSNGRARLVLLQIKLDVALLDTTLFMNTFKVDSYTIGDGYKFLAEARAEANNEGRQKGVYVSCLPRLEVLAKTYIPADYILNLNNPKPITSI